MIYDEYGSRRFYGVYRGVVVENQDPKNEFRLKLKIPQVLHDQVSDWAWGVHQPGVSRSIPEISSGVWVSFEGGDPSYPVWTGSFKTGDFINASIASSLAGGVVGNLPIQSGVNTTSFVPTASSQGKVLSSLTSAPYASWVTPTPYKMLAGVTTGGAVSVTFTSAFAAGVVPVVTAAVLSTNNKPEIFVLNSVDNSGFTGQVWSSSGTNSPYNNFATAVNRTIHWTAVQLTP